MPSLQAGAPEAPSGDEFLRVEERGIEPIPRAERHATSRELAFLWAGAFVNYASLLTASLLTGFFGLGIWDGLAAVVIGTVSAAFILGLLSHTGPRTGLPQIAFTRRIFGRNGARIGALLTLILAVGWFAVDSVIAALAGVQLLQLMGMGAAAGKLALPFVLVIVIVSIAVAVYGHATIRAFETWGAIAFALLSVILFAALAPQFRWGTGPSVRGADFPAAFVLGVMVSVALVASSRPPPVAGPGRERAHDLPGPLRSSAAHHRSQAGGGRGRSAGGHSQSRAAVGGGSLLRLRDSGRGLGQLPGRVHRRAGGPDHRHQAQALADGAGLRGPGCAAGSRGRHHRRLSHRLPAVPPPHLSLGACLGGRRAAGFLRAR